METCGNLRYKHYEKPMASKLVISARSAHPKASKRAVHVNEILRRLLNTSRELDWDEHVAPILSEYMERMKAAGYNQDYRQHVLKNALAIYDAKLRDHDDGIKPLNRPRGFQKIERRKGKHLKKKDWGKKGGYAAPIIIPSTPDGILAKMLRQIADSEATPNLRLKTMEKGGRRLESTLSKPNPTASDTCVRKDHPKRPCIGCNQPDGISNCHKSNCLYNYQCKFPDCNGVYVGETSRNCYSRSLEHQTKYSKNNSDSFIIKHQNEFHDGQPANMKFNFVKSFKDPLSRQVTESIHIFRTQSDGNLLMNSKSEWRQPSMIETRTEIVRRNLGS